jgi:hypothetical protein
MKPDPGRCVPAILRYVRMNAAAACVRTSENVRAERDREEDIFLEWTAVNLFLPFFGPQAPAANRALAPDGKQAWDTRTSP